MPICVNCDHDESFHSSWVRGNVQMWKCYKVNNMNSKRCECECYRKVDD